MSVDEIFILYYTNEQYGNARQTMEFSDLDEAIFEAKEIKARLDAEFLGIDIIKNDEIVGHINKEVKIWKKRY